MQRIPTAIDGLDSILNGGIFEFSTILVCGAPGSGKTILAQNIMFNLSATAGLRAVYLTTLSEPQIKIIRYQQHFSFFSLEAFMESVLYHDIGSVIRSKGVKAGLKIMHEIIMEHRPSVLVVDSLKAVLDMLPTHEQAIDFISELNIYLPIWECTALLIAEYSEEELKQRIEAAAVDGIIYLYGTEEKRYQKRYLRVLKMRGTAFQPGEHIFRITGEGIKVYPRWKPDLQKQSYCLGKKLHSSGTPGLDKLLGGGLPSVTTTLICGPTGTGKSLLALNWLKDGAENNEPGLLVTFEQNREQLLENTSLFGWNLHTFLEQGLLEIMYVSPVELDVDFHAFEMRRIVEDKKISRLVIDSISAFEIGMTDKFKFTNYLWELTDFFKMKKVSVMLLNEIHDLSHALQISKHGISYLADNIIILHLLQDNFNLRRMIGALKVRGRRHPTEIKEIVLSAQGPSVLVNKNIFTDREQRNDKHI